MPYKTHSQSIYTVFMTGMIVVFLFSGCQIFAPKSRSPKDPPVPEAYTLYDHAPPPPDRWWETFQSEELNQLVEKALAGNLNLQQVYARLTQAEMLARQSGAALFPAAEITGSLAATRRRVDTGESVSGLDIATEKAGALSTLLATPGTPANPLDAAATGLRSAQSKLGAVQTLTAEPRSSSRTSVSHSYLFGVGLSYEVDLWGRLRAQKKAARLAYAATNEEVQAAMFSLSGLVAIQWLTIVSQRQELAVVERQLGLDRTILELIELRYRNGLATALDVYQQRQVIAQIESVIPPLEAKLQTACHELAVLIGEPPRSELNLAAPNLPELGALPDPGLPADLLARRPDLRAAGLQLQAADWRVSAARADRLPALRLSASANYSAEEWELLFNNWMATLAGSLTGPIFDAGRRKAEVERTRAVARERLIAYQEQVLTAVKEVENALLQESKQTEYIAALERELESVRIVYDQALERYRKGANDYLAALTALLQWQSLERRLVQAQYTRLSQRVQLCLALGGTWMSESRKQEKKTK